MKLISIKGIDNDSYIYMPSTHTLFHSKTPQRDIVEIIENHNVDDEDSYGLRQFYDKVELNKITNTVPSLGFIITTNKCNMGCSFCYANKNTSEEENFNIEWIKKLKSILPETSFSNVTISGGEPLLDFELVKELRPMFKNVTIYTNGALLNDEIAKWAINTKTRLYIALDYQIDGCSLHDTVDVREKLDVLTSTYPLLGSLIDIAITYPANKLSELDDARMQKKAFEHIADHDFNYFHENGDIDNKDLIRTFESEIYKLESGKVNIGESLFKKYFRYIQHVVTEYVNTTSCSQSITINFNGDIFACQVLASNISDDNYKNNKISHIDEFTLDNYYKYIVNNKVKSVCKYDCPARFFCANICWKNIEYNRHNCKVARVGIWYALYIMINYSNVDMTKAITLERLDIDNLELKW